MGVGIVAMKAALAARKGASLLEVADVAREAAQRCRVFAGLETIEFLARGGRIGAAKGLMGRMLRIRPMIIVREGEAHELGKERTRARVVAKLLSTVEEFAPIEEICVLHSNTPDDADALAQDLKGLLPQGKEPLHSRFGPVLGTHVGPGALGIGLLRAQ